MSKGDQGFDTGSTHSEVYQGTDEKHALLSEDVSGHSHSDKKKKKCGVYFGVKSYLHNFYDSGHIYKDPEVYEDDDFRYLLHPVPRRRKCPPVCWKIFMWVGVNLLVFGVLGILVGYLVPQKLEYHNVVSPDNKPGIFVDEQAVRYNTTLDMCKLIGLILFCIGGAVLAMALLFPSFLHHYCEDDGPEEDPVKVSIADEEPPTSPLEKSIPFAGEIKNVQPTRRSPESTVTRGGLRQLKEESETE